MKNPMMGQLTFFVIAGLMALSACCAADREPDSEMRSGQVDSIDGKAVSNAFAGRKGAFVLIDCATGEISDFYPESSSGLLPPCSTFKRHYRE